MLGPKQRRQLRARRNAERRVLQARSDAIVQYSPSPAIPCGPELRTSNMSKSSFELHGFRNPKMGHKEYTGPKKYTRFSEPPRMEALTNETALVKVGITKARKLVIADKETGEKRLIRLTEKPRFVPVGLSSSIPNKG